MKFQFPLESITEFVTRKVSKPRCLWVDHKVFSEAKALEYSYCIHNCREAVSEYLPLQRMQSADRYGGYGVGYCGGSARCGTYGDVQVKGIGLTPLIGSSPGAPLDPWHSSGTVTLNEAGREALWSGICDAVLPFGAVATTAVVLTGTKCLRTDGAPGVEILNRRALIMREVALRPAHFLRNVHFQTPLVPGAPACEDYFRVRQMVRSLPINFDQAFGAEIEGSSATARVSSGMKIMANRFAAQVAAAFAKRLYHGSLNCTNIALDGRYVDFGTMTAVNAYRRQAGSPLWPDQWSQHTPLLRTLTYLLFHVRKHLDCPEIKNLIAPDELTAEFSAALHQRTQIELLKQTGIPEQTIATYPEAKRSRAYRCLKDVYSRGAHTSFVWRGDDDPSMVGVQPLQSLGRYDLNEILTKAAQCSDESALRSVIDTLLGDACLAREFCEVYADIVEWFLESHSGMNPAVLRAFLARQAMRLNADVSHLTREALDTAMAEFEENPSGLGAYIDGTIRNAREIMDDEPPEMLDAHGRAICGLTGQLEALGQMRPDQAFAMLGYGSQGNVHADTAKAHGQAICATA